VEASCADGVVLSNGGVVHTGALTESSQ
jgi:hypothetical protein